MKIKKRKKNDRHAFFTLSPYDYELFRQRRKIHQQLANQANKVMPHGR